MMDRELVLEAVRRLPEDTDLDRIAEEVAFLSAVKEGLDQVGAGAYLSHVELSERIPSWIMQ